MEQQNDKPAIGQGTKRRPWAAPNIVTVVPVGRTQGGNNFDTFEFALYRVS